ncbi:GOLPH3/VPS74 family protein [Allokutzneria albata]|uniref:Golgi phosphoprotein 3 (GPP34) n=1 Tax=Allokutzneria albata TaxID=211114 RepID=A0A1G9WK48_ALLAB|nr:GPP34 family phosphoprotein [Allokutzneria albata]SDM84425.1 Golgi phosphoprotein 3 (GPP34) [Allokutzneria albata]
MHPPDSLPARLFLLAYDQDRGRLTGGAALAPLLRAAALAELHLGGGLADVRGKAHAVAATASGDPVLDQVLALVGSAKARSWQYWITYRPRTTVAAVREALVASGHIRVTRRRGLGLFRTTKITLVDPGEATHIASLASEALRGAWPVAEVDLRDAAVVCLAAAAKLRTVVSRADRRAYRGRLAELSARVGPVPTALRKALQAQNGGSASGDGD